MAQLLAHHQVPCYFSLAKQDSHTKSKSLVSHDYSYWIVFGMDRNVMAEITELEPLCFSLRLCTLISSYSLGLDSGGFRTARLTGQVTRVARVVGLWVEKNLVPACPGLEPLMGLARVWNRLWV